MKWLSAGLTFVNTTVLTGLLLGMAARGLSGSIAVISFLVGLGAALAAGVMTKTTEPATDDPVVLADNRLTIARLCFWTLAACFAFFAFRSFCWLIFIDGNQLKVQSPNNLGDLALHITYIKNFASGVPLWPDNPIHPLSKMRYPAGTDLFNALLLLLGIDLIKGLVWAGLAGALATFLALYKWGGSFTVAGFLFNGGLAGWAILHSGKFLDYQGTSTVAWKSLPLAMLVTQRGLLYALPAGLLLLCHWRAKYLADHSTSGSVVAGIGDSGSGNPGGVATSLPGPDQRSGLQDRARLQQLPFWVELSLYATMPLFHLHTFIALSLVAAFLFLVGQRETRRQMLLLVTCSVVPATFLVWTVTDNFRAKSLLQWHPGWVQNTGEFAAPFFLFWFSNFGVFLPLAVVLLGLCFWRTRQSAPSLRLPAAVALAFLGPAATLFLFACLVKTAPWEWDNIKLIIWAYLIMLPFLWSELIAAWPMPARLAVCLALFTSGFVSLFGGLTIKKEGYGLAERAEVDGVGSAVSKISPLARFAAYPTYNHPLLLQGRRVVLGYPGHLWTQGFDYAPLERQLTSLMQGAPDWKERARTLGVRYIFWGREEKASYAASTRPWEKEAVLTASGSWGSIYDLGARP